MMESILTGLKVLLQNAMDKINGTKEEAEEARNNLRLAVMTMIVNVIMIFMGKNKNLKSAYIAFVKMTRGIFDPPFYFAIGRRLSLSPRDIGHSLIAADLPRGDVFFAYLLAEEGRLSVKEIIEMLTPDPDDLLDLRNCGIYWDKIAQAVNELKDEKTRRQGKYNLYNAMLKDSRSDSGVIEFFATTFKGEKEAFLVCAYRNETNLQDVVKIYLEWQSATSEEILGWVGVEPHLMPELTQALFENAQVKTSILGRLRQRGLPLESACSLLINDSHDFNDLESIIVALKFSGYDNRDEYLATNVRRVLGQIDPRMIGQKKLSALLDRI